jgi:hypothetical protein
MVNRKWIAQTWARNLTAGPVWRKWNMSIDIWEDLGASALDGRMVEGRASGLCFYTPADTGYEIWAVK